MAKKQSNWKMLRLQKLKVWNRQSLFAASAVHKFKKVSIFKSQYFASAV